jgi:predicted dienelactone hydrolase
MTMTTRAQWTKVAAVAALTIAFAFWPARDVLAVEVPPLALPGPYAVECSNIAQDPTRLAPGEDVESYWEGVARANGSARRPADLLADPAHTPTITVDAPNNRTLFGSFAGRPYSFVVVICHPTTAANPRPDYTLPTGQIIPHMLRGSESPLWPDATARFPVLLFSHGYGDAPIESAYLYAMTVFASFGYVVAAPFHTDAAFSNLRDLEGFLDFLYLVTHLEEFNAMQALRPLALSKTLDLVLSDPQWRDRVDAARVGGFGASMGAESLLLMGGAELTTNVLQDSMPVTFDPRLKAAVGYVPYLGQIGFSAFGRGQHGLDGVTLPFLGISGTADFTAPLSETLRAMERLAGTRELVTLAGVEHKFDVPSAPDTFTWALTWLDSEVRSDSAGRAKIRSMTSVTGGGDDRVLLAYNGPPTVTPVPLNVQGTWWAAPAGSESGWGINFTHQGNTVFATWFTHDANGNAWQLSMTAVQTAPNTFSGELLRTIGPPLDAPFNPDVVQRIPVGTGTLTFSDAAHGTFQYTVDGVAQAKAITPFVFGPMPTCRWGALANMALATNYTDTWWAPAESGWGIDFAHQGDVIFGSWFTFDWSGNPLSMSATLFKTAPGVYVGTIIRTTGPPFSAAPFDSGAVHRNQVGTMTVTFGSGNAATLAFTVSMDGKSTSQAKSITRFVFRPPGTVCA